MLELLQFISTNAWYILLVAFFFGGSIFVHELGHFLAARWRGLKIDRFSIGFGRKIVSWNRHGVEYRLSWIPLGGYVALPQLADMRGIEGEPSSETEALPPISYTDKMIVSVAGAVFNLIFAFLLASVLWVIGQPERADQTSTTIGYVMDTMSVEGADGATRQVKSPAAEAGLRAGDRILTIDGDAIENWDDVREAIITGSQRSDDGRRQSDFLIERDGEVRQITVHPRLAGDESIRQAGIAPAYDVIVERVLPGSPADRIGLQSGDVFVAIDGVPIRNEVTYFDVLTAEAAAPRELVVRRNDQEITLSLPSERGPIVVNVVPESPAAEIGLQAGDRILSVNGRNLVDSRSLVDELDRLRDQALNLVVQRGADTIAMTAPARPGSDGKLGVEVTSLLGEELTIPASIAYINPVRQFEKHIRSTFRVLGSLLHPQSDIGLSKMSGPVGIMRVYYHAVRAEFRFVLWLTILVNINLAIFNLLPIPVLDGGHMLFATITKLRGRAIPPQLLVTVQSTFMALLLLMVIYVTFFDVRRSIRDISGDSPRAAPPPEAPAENPDSSGAQTPEAP